MKGRIKKPKLDKDMAKLKAPVGVFPKPKSPGTPPPGERGGGRKIQYSTPAF